MYDKVFDQIIKCKDFQRSSILNLTGKMQIISDLEQPKKLVSLFSIG